MKWYADELLADIHTYIHTYRDESDTEYGKAFMKWYADELLAHGARVLGCAQQTFEPYKIEISGKVQL
jgi:hypothetical protein